MTELWFLGEDISQIHTPIKLPPLGILKVLLSRFFSALPRPQQDGGLSVSVYIKVGFFRPILRFIYLLFISFWTDISGGI